MKLTAEKKDQAVRFDLHLAGQVVGKCKTYPNHAGNMVHQVVVEPPDVDALDGYFGAIGDTPEMAIAELQKAVRDRIARMTVAADWIDMMVEKDKEADNA